MRICQGCGGVLGRDCFNEMECISISHSQQSNLEYRIEVLEKTVFKLIGMLKNHNINFDEIEEVPKMVEAGNPIDDLPF